MSIDIDKTLEDYKELRLIIIEEQSRVQQEVLPLLEAAKKEYDSENWFVRKVWSNNTRLLDDSLRLLEGVMLIQPPLLFWDHISFEDGYKIIKSRCNYPPENRLPDINNDKYKLDPDNFERLVGFVNWAKVYSRFVIGKGVVNETSSNIISR